MTRCTALLLVMAAALSRPAPTLAQTQGAIPPPPSAPRETRPATLTFVGDTGMWFVPTAEVLPERSVAIGGFLANFDFNPGSTDVAHIAASGAFGVTSRLELFGSFRLVTRVDRDGQPLFAAPADATGGVVNDFPTVTRDWVQARGDIVVGAKLNLLSESRQRTFALAVRPALKLPTGNDDEGASSGGTDFTADVVASRELSRRVEVAAYGGLALRGAPDDFDLQDGWRYGVGVMFPTRPDLRVFAELHGEKLIGDGVVYTGTATANDGSPLPMLSPQRSPLNITLGATYQADNGVIVGAGLNIAPNQTDVSGGSRVGLQVRVGYHPGVSVYVHPLPPPQPPPVGPRTNQPPTVRARCEPCVIEGRGSVTLTAEAQDPEATRSPTPGPRRTARSSMPVTGRPSSPPAGRGRQR